MKRLLYLPLLLIYFFTACGVEKPLTTYEYEEEEVLPFSILKMAVYEDRIQVYFSEDALSRVKEVICYDEDFDTLDKDADADADDDVLTVYSDDSEDIRGLRVTLSNWEYWDIRYLDSDRPAILLYTWADDYGYMCNGDEDAYYTQEEKDAQAKRAEEALARRDAAMAKLSGTWEDESGTVRMKIYFEERPVIEVYALSDGEWTMTQSVYADWAGEDNSNDPDVVSLYIEEGRGYGCMYFFTLYNNMTECECDFAEGRMKRVEE